MSHNQIGDIETLGLGGLRQLKVLHLTANRIVKINGLDGCRELQHLVMDKNCIRHLDGSGFALNHKLKIFRAQENGMKTFSNLDTLQGCQTMVLGSNRISDFKVLEQFAAMPELQELTLSSQAIARKQNYRVKVLRHLFNLRVLDGVEITDDERIKLLGMQGYNAQANPYLYEQQQAALAQQTAYGVHDGYGQQLFGHVEKAPSVSIMTLGMQRGNGRQQRRSGQQQHHYPRRGTQGVDGIAQAAVERPARGGNGHHHHSNHASSRQRHTVYAERRESGRNRSASNGGGAYYDQRSNRSQIQAQTHSQSHMHQYTQFSRSTDQQRAYFADSVVRQQSRGNTADQRGSRFRSLPGAGAGERSHPSSRLSSFGIRQEHGARQRSRR